MMSLARATQPQERPRSLACVLPASCPTRAIVAHASEEVRRRLRAMLERMGFDVIEAEDGRELFWHLEACVHDRGAIDAIVIAHADMSVYGGLDVIEAWRDAPWTCAFLLTADAGSHVDEARVRGAGGLLLPGPVQLEELHRRVAHACTIPGPVTPAVERDPEASRCTLRAAARLVNAASR